MVNGVLSEIEFENQLSKLGDNQLELIKFVARQQYDSSKTLCEHDKRITDLETSIKKSSGIAGGITGTISGVIVTVISYFFTKS